MLDWLEKIDELLLDLRNEYAILKSVLNPYHGTGATTYRNLDEKWVHIYTLLQEKKDEHYDAQANAVSPIHPPTAP